MTGSESRPNTAELPVCSESRNSDRACCLMLTFLDSLRAYSHEFARALWITPVWTSARFSPISDLGADIKPRELRIFV